ncbi:MAG: DUF6064 family protein [Alphaproteobacteria bacterium]|nr:DUF6064 family protein [Alphaproteobacteria bacterium]
MGAWSTYSLEDFLLFSPRVYWRLFELHNAELWPLQIPALALGLLILWLVLSPRPSSDRVIAALLAIAWIAVGWLFLWQRYATINWAIAYTAPVFVVQGLLLVVGSITGHLRFRVARRWPEATGLALVVYALLLHPFAAPLLGRPFAAAEIAGITSDPTAIATLGLLLTASSTRLIWLLLPIPVAWCVLSAVTLLAMDAPDAWIPLAAVAIVVLAGLGHLVFGAITRRRAPSPTGSPDRRSPAPPGSDRHSPAPPP